MKCAEVKSLKYSSPRFPFALIKRNFKQFVCGLHLFHSVWHAFMKNWKSSRSRQQDQTAQNTGFWIRYPVYTSYCFYIFVGVIVVLGLIYEHL